MSAPSNKQKCRPLLLNGFMLCFRPKWANQAHRLSTQSKGKLSMRLMHAAKKRKQHKPLTITINISGGSSTIGISACFSLCRSEQRHEYFDCTVPLTIENISNTANSKKWVPAAFYLISKDRP